MATEKISINGIRVEYNMSKRKHGRYGAVRHIRDDVYEVSYYPYPKAKRKFKWVRASSEREAHIRRAEIMSQYGKGSPSTSLPFPQLKTRLEQKLKADNLTPKSIKNYMGKFDKVTSFLSSKGITDINHLTKVAVEEYKQYATSKHPTGWRDELTKIKTITKKLVDIGCCNEDIYREVLGGFKKPPRGKKLYKDISIEQIRKLLKYIEKDRPDYYGITYVIARLGWRIGQVVALKRANLRWNKNALVEIQAEPQDTKTKVPFILRDIDREIAEVIRRYTLKNNSLYLFPNRCGGRHNIGHYRDYIKKTSQEVISITLTPHDFRHAFCTNRLKEGQTPRDIMAVTGHRDMDSFNIYTHPTSEGTKKVIENSRIF